MPTDLLKLYEQNAAFATDSSQAFNQRPAVMVCAIAVAEGNKIMFAHACQSNKELLKILQDLCKELKAGDTTDITTARGKES